eukprot:3441546-Heterocapsa_arctica.AAC.1
MTTGAAHPAEEVAHRLMMSRRKENAASSSSAAASAAEIYAASEAAGRREAVLRGAALSRQQAIRAKQIPPDPTGRLWMFPADP